LRYIGYDDKRWGALEALCLSAARSALLGTFRRCLVDAERGAQQMAAARWYAYLCSLRGGA